jgi:hypothetical protein
MGGVPGQACMWVCYGGCSRSSKHVGLLWGVFMSLLWGVFQVKQACGFVMGGVHEFIMGGVPGQACGFIMGSNVFQVKRATIQKMMSFPFSIPCAMCMCSVYTRCGRASFSMGSSLCINSRLTLNLYTGDCFPVHPDPLQAAVI